MLFEDNYFTVSESSEGFYKDRGSKFLAYAYPIKTEQEAKIRIEKIKKDHPKARHWCWAYRLSLEKDVYRLNDDGEPSGTAGRPILNILWSKNLTYVLIVVVRYFGGTLLGVSGLINAYKEATSDVLQNAKIIERHIKNVYQILLPYSQVSALMKICQSFTVQIKTQNYDSESCLIVAIRKSQTEAFLQAISKVEGVNVSFFSEEI